MVATDQMPIQLVERTGASRFAQRQIERHRRLASSADLIVPAMKRTRIFLSVGGPRHNLCGVVVCSRPPHVEAADVPRQANRVMVATHFGCRSVWQRSLKWMLE